MGVPEQQSIVSIALRDDGTTHVSIGVSDIGGGQRSSIAQIVAHTLGISIADVSLELADTARTPSIGPTAASKTLYYGGNAAFAAADTIRKRILEVASGLLQCNPSKVKIQNGTIFVIDQEERTISLARVVAEAKKSGVPLEELSTFVTPDAKRFDSLHRYWS